MATSRYERSPAVLRSIRLQRAEPHYHRVAAIRASPLVPDDVAVRGFVYDVRSGRLREVA